MTRSVAFGGTMNRRVRRLRPFTIALVMIFAIMTLVQPINSQASTTSATISSEGPLASITISDDLNCDIRYSDDSMPAFYGGTACATFVSVDDTLYGPASIPAGGAATPRTPFTTVSQSAVQGAGTVSDPFRIETVVKLGNSGLTLTQKDSYVTGQDRYKTQIKISNSGSSEKALFVYRGMDCYLANSDLGYGSIAPDEWAACLNQSKERILQVSDLGTGVPVWLYQGGYSSVWAAIGAQRSFDNTCACDSYIDNGIGINWLLRISSGYSDYTTSSIAFTPNGNAGDRDGDGLKDSWETNGLTEGGETLPLKTWGADPDRKDVFLQLNWMKTKTCSLWGRIWLDCRGAASLNVAPTKSQIQKLVDAYDEQGITLHVDAGDVYPMKPDGTKWPAPKGGATIEYRKEFASSNGTFHATLDQVRSTQVTGGRDKVFHLGILGDQIWSRWGQDSLADFIGLPSGRGELPGDSFFVARGGLSGDAAISGTIMHEFGHNLGLAHGGPMKFPDHDLNCKPAYKSTMNYLFQDLMIGFTRERTSSDRGLTLSEIARCKATGADEWPTQAHTAEADWTNLIFDAGEIGGLSSGSLIPTEYLDEPSPEMLLDAGVGGTDGSGGVVVTRPGFLIAGLGDQTVDYRITNTGNTAASYVLEVSLGDRNMGVFEQGVPAGGSTTLSVPVPTDLLGAPALVTSATLSSTLLDTPLQTYDLEIGVLPNQPESASLALAELDAHADGMSVDELAYIRALLTRASGDRVPPLISWDQAVPADGTEYLFGDLPSSVPTCTATDEQSGLSEEGCVVTGYSVEVGEHTLAATAHDSAGNVATLQKSYRVKSWDLVGFRAPVKVSQVTTVRSGSVLPLKFEVFKGSTELTYPTDIGASLTYRQLTNGSQARPVQTAGGAPLRYDTDAGQFIVNWSTSGIKPGEYEVQLVVADGSTLTTKVIVR